MLLHKTIFTKPVTRPKDYLKYINSYFGASFSSFEEFKKSNNCKDLIGKITLDGVENAVRNSESFMERKSDSVAKSIFHKCKYYVDNTSMNVFELVSLILKETGVN